jgi:hypothetical protein
MLSAALAYIPQGGNTVFYLNHVRLVNQTKLE